MGTVSGYYAPDEMPEFRDPTPEEMMENTPVEERVLVKVRLLRGIQRECLPSGKDRDDAIVWCDQIEAYLLLAIAERGRDYERDMDSDPFADEDGK